MKKLLLLFLVGSMASCYSADEATTPDELCEEIEALCYFACREHLAGELEGLVEADLRVPGSALSCKG